MTAPNGRCLSSRRKITQGLPQRGVLSPFLWILHSNSLSSLARIDQEQWDSTLRDTPSLALKYADDVSLAAAHEEAEALVEVANLIARNATKNLADMGLNLSPPKSSNLAISPCSMVGGVFRRSTCDATAPAAKVQKEDRKIDKRLEAAAGPEEVPEMVFPPRLREDLPVK